MQRSHPPYKSFGSCTEIAILVYGKIDSVSACFWQWFSQEYLYDQEVATVEELFDCLKEFCFLDYALLEITVNFFLKENRKIISDLNDYIQKLTRFKSSTTIKVFMDNIEEAHKTITTEDGTAIGTVKLRLVGRWLKKTMLDLEMLLEELFQDKKSLLAHLELSLGSVLVTYLVPKSKWDILIEKAQSRLLFMPQVGVCELQIGPTTVIDNTQKPVIHLSFESSLIAAVKNDDINVVIFLLNINTNPNATDDEGQTALMIASCNGQEKTVNILLDVKSDPNTQRHDGVTALYMAAQNGHTNIVEILLRAKANPQILTNDGSTPLQIAKQNKHTDIVTALQSSEKVEAETQPVTQDDKLHESTFQQIVTFGKSGSGRTSLASAIANVDMDNNADWDSGIKTIATVVNQVTKGIVNVFDTIGSCSTNNTCEVLKDFGDCGNGLIIVCISMFEQLDESTLEPLAQLTGKYGWARWYRVIIALTKADRYEEYKWLASGSRNKSDRFAEELTKRRNIIKEIFTATADQVQPRCYIGMTEEQFEDVQIPIIPTSELNKNALDRMEQVGHGYWFDLLLIKCCQKLKGSGLQIHSDRLSQLPAELLRQEVEDMSQEVLQRRSRFRNIIPNFMLWTSYCTNVKTTPRFEIKKNKN